LFAVESVQDATEEIVRRPPGRVLFGFLERKLKQQVERFIGLLYTFDPDRADERTYEIMGECCEKVVKALSKLFPKPYYVEAAAKVTEASKWIASGYSPAHPPSDDELKTVREKHTRRLLEVLST
jgi:hypothetical protein